MRRRLVGPVGLAEDRERGQAALWPVETAVDLGGVEEQVAVVRRDCQRAVKVGERLVGAAAREGHPAPQVPRSGRARRRRDGLVGEAVGVVEEAEFHVHPAAIEAEGHLAR